MKIKTRDEPILWLLTEYSPNHKFEYYKSLQERSGFVDNESKKE